MDGLSMSDILNRFYLILKRTMVGKIFCHGLVLDVGCSEGSVPNKDRMTGLDLDKKRLKNCSYEFKVLGDACSLPFKDKSFDVAIEMNCLMYVKDLRSALKEMLRVGRRVYIIESIRRKKRQHWLPVSNLLTLGIPLFFILRSIVIMVRHI